MKNKISLIGLAGLLVLFSAGQASAGRVDCPDPIGDHDRTAYWDSATGACSYGLGNPDAADVAGEGGGDASDWMEISEHAFPDGTTGETTDGPLTINLLSGEWGGTGPMEGTWTLPDDFWDTYSIAVVSIHVGGGGEGTTPDHFLWTLTSADGTSGTWGYDGSCNDCTGGGLSNIKLWVNEVPEPMTLGLLGIGLLGMGIRRRRKA